MGRIEEIYYMLQDKESKEEIRWDWERLSEFERKSKISLEEDKVFFPMVDYVEACKRESFKKGFRYAIQLMREYVVSGRELWSGLQSKQDFSTWMKKRISECDAIENMDYEVFHKKMENLEGGRPSKEYLIKLDTAKEMAMLERNEIGKQVRKYFIAVEKKFKKLLPQGEELIALAVVEAQKLIMEKNKLLAVERPDHR